MREEDLDKLIDVKTGAEFVGVTGRTLRAWLAQDPPPFPVARLGKRCLRFKLRDLVSWVESRMSARRDA
jgi:hypothetical protein